MSARPRLLVTHPWMGQGGSEATAAWTVHALQEVADVTFVTASGVDWAAINATYLSSVDPARVRTLRAPRLPGVKSGSQLVALQQGLFTRHCRGLAKDFDGCVSTYNFLDFGRPALQLLADFSWDDALQREVNPAIAGHLRGHGTLVRRAYLAAARRLRGDDGAVPPARGDLVLANSRWTAATMARLSPVPVSGILYPPVPGTGDGDKASRDEPRREPGRFLILGRIAPEKRVLEMLRILQGVRRQGHSIRVAVAGSLGASSYADEVGHLARECGDWVELPGFITGTVKSDLLARSSWALHGTVGEAFGIAVAELALSGCIPIVPGSGGAAEVIPLPELHYASEEEAVRRIAGLLGAPGDWARLRGAVSRSVRTFTPERFVRELRHWVSKLPGLDAPACIEMACA